MLRISDLRKNKGLSLGEVAEILERSPDNGDSTGKEGVNDSVKWIHQENELLKQENEFLKERLKHSEERQ